jgi:hypothetical protein
MALDLHIANNRKEASYNRSGASLDLPSHRLIFSRLPLASDKFPLFKKLENYYEDTNYSAEELADLIDEVRQIKELLSENKELTRQLNELLITCDRALKEGLSIWVFCD